MKFVPGTLQRIFMDVATDTPCLFATGDLVMAFHKAEFSGIITNSVITALTLSSRIYQSMTGKGQGLGYIPVTLNQAWTGGSIIAQGIHDYGGHDLFFSFAPQAL